jgi:ABC-type dipeptide/oligopeptide/nickel transport system ATPase component
MRQRAALAIALAGNPALLIMDEALGALDLVVRHQICDTLLELSQQRGFAILFISHDLLLTLALADRVGVLLAGKLVEVGAAAEMRARPIHPYTRALLTSFLDPLATLTFPATPDAGERSR